MDKSHAHGSDANQRNFFHVNHPFPRAPEDDLSTNRGMTFKKSRNVREFAATVVLVQQLGRIMRPKRSCSGDPLCPAQALRYLSTETQPPTRSCDDEKVRRCQVIPIGLPSIIENWRPRKSLWPRRQSRMKRGLNTTRWLLSIGALHRPRGGRNH